MNRFKSIQMDGVVLFLLVVITLFLVAVSVVQAMGLQELKRESAELERQIADLEFTWEETWNKYQVDPSNFDWGLSMHISRVEQQMDDIYFYQMDMIRCIEDVGIQTLEELAPCIRKVDSVRYCVMLQDGCTDSDIRFKILLGWNEEEK